VQGLHYLLKGSIISSRAPLFAQRLNYSAKGSIIRARAQLFHQGLNYSHKGSIISAKAPLFAQRLHSPARSIRKKMQGKDENSGTGQPEQEILHSESILIVLIHQNPLLCRFPGK